MGRLSNKAGHENKINIEIARSVHKRLLLKKVEWDKISISDTIEKLLNFYNTQREEGGN